MAEKFVSKRCMEQIPVPGPIQVPEPSNCKCPCPYGVGRTFCFPCIANIVPKKGN